MRRRIVRLAGFAAVSTVLASGAVLMSGGAASADAAGSGVRGLVIVGSTPASGGIVVHGGSLDGTRWTPNPWWGHRRHHHHEDNEVGELGSLGPLR